MKASEIKETFASLVPAVVLVSRWQLEGKASSIRKTQMVSDRHIFSSFTQLDLSMFTL